MRGSSPRFSLLSRTPLTFGQACGLLLTLIMITVAVSLPIALIGHSSDTELSTHPAILGLINLIAFGYVIRQSIRQQGEPYRIALPVIPIDSRHLLPMLCTLAGCSGVQWAGAGCRGG